MDPAGNRSELVGTARATAGEIKPEAGSYRVSPVSSEVSRVNLNSLLSPRILTARHEGSSDHSRGWSWDAHGAGAERSGQRQEVGSVQAVHRLGRGTDSHTHATQIRRRRRGDRNLGGTEGERNCRLSRSIASRSE